MVFTRDLRVTDNPALAAAAAGADQMIPVFVLD
jgi:deoxyribodipyrimidine photo-lyase